MAEQQSELRRIVNGVVEDYQAFLHESYRPPSRGGNTSALHIHHLIIAGERYTFFARGTKKWVYKGDSVSFEYVVKDGKYRNVIPETVETKDKDGKVILRGDRRWKEIQRTAPARMPASRREQRS
jgi:hypothetical protein